RRWPSTLSLTGQRCAESCQPALPMALSSSCHLRDLEEELDESSPEADRGGPAGGRHAFRMLNVHAAAGKPASVRHGAYERTRILIGRHDHHSGEPQPPPVDPARDALDYGSRLPRGVL